MRNKLAILCLAAAATSSGLAGDSRLEAEIGRSEIRVWSAPYFITAGRTVADAKLVERLEQNGYRRVRRRPETPGTFFYGHTRFWIYRQAHRRNGTDYAPSLIGLELRREDGLILGAMGLDDRPYPLEREGAVWIEPLLLAESLDGSRARRRPVAFDELPEHVWRVVLAAEDSRFFDHGGVDARSVARAALANTKQGRVAQGGSTITQQLVKNRDLTPKRSLGRKASEAMRALALEADYDKREILQAYLNQVYLGHVDGLAVHGIGAASRAHFSLPPERLDLARAALLAALIQGPNRLSPDRHPERARERRDWVLGRMEELGWAEAAEVRRARSSGLGIERGPIEPEPARHFLSWVADEVRDEADSRLERGRGVVVETTLDPWLQRQAEDAVSAHLRELRRRYPRLRNAPLSAALVALDATDGSVRAYVGGDPERRDRFDRVRSARRQPGSTVKPFVMLEAFESCGRRSPLHPATQVADEPLQVDLDGKIWAPENYDRRHRGVIDLRTTLADSRNVPTVRVARHCGFAATAQTFRAAGLRLPAEPPPAFVLGAVEVSPLEVAAAYTVLAAAGRRLEPRSVARLERPGGRALWQSTPRGHRVARASSAWLVRHMMGSAVEEGTAGVGAIAGFDVAAKTGSSSDLRDAWFAGHAGRLVTVVWVGLDEGRLGLTGSAAAGPVWRTVMEQSVPLWNAPGQEPPAGVVEAWIDSRTGLLVRERNRHARREWFRRGAQPRRDRFWRMDDPIPVVR